MYLQRVSNSNEPIDSFEQYMYMYVIDFTHGDPRYTIFMFYCF